jgi:predicted anti-sigma-YlaC factor YlaD
MDCEKFKEWISRRADGPLDEGEERALREHLAGCEECAAFRDDLARMKEFYAAWSAPRVPEGLRERVLQGGRLELARRRRRSLLSGAARLCAAALVMVAVTIGYFCLDGLEPAQATDTNREVHYADILYQGGGKQDDALLEALLGTNNPREALHVYTEKRRP